MKQQRFDPGGRWQETDLKNGWTVREDFVLENGRRVVGTLTIRATGDVPPGGVTARLLRTIRVGQLGWALRATHAKFFGPEAAARIFKRRGMPRRRKRSQGVRADDRYYAELANAYVALLESGSRTPTKALATQLKEPYTRMRSRVNLARANGFLSAGQRGRGGCKGGGMLTDKARQVLAQEVTK
jgi:hypothetical protein